MTLQDLNDVFFHINNMDAKFKKVSETSSSNYWDEKNQGEEGDKEVVYDIGNNLYLKLGYKNDSYGDNETLDSIKFVLKKEKETTVYE